MQIAFGLPRVGAMAEPAVRPVRRYAQTGWRCSYLSSLVTCVAAIAVCALWIVLLMPTSAEAQGAVDKPAQGEGGCLTEKAKQSIDALTIELAKVTYNLNWSIRARDIYQEHLERLQVRLREDEAEAKVPATEANRAVRERAVERDKSDIAREEEAIKRSQNAIDADKELKASLEAELEKLKGLGPCKDKTAAAPLPPSRPTPLPKPERRKVALPMPSHKPPAEHFPPTAFPFGPNGPFETVTFEFSGYGGAVAASSFGSDFNPDIWGGRGAVRIPVGQLRLQADIEGERTSDYSSIVGKRSYFAGGAHVDWMWPTNTEIGAFGGFQDATPTFFGPASTNNFIGLEGRQFFGPAMLGAQFGRFDVSNGPGTLTDAWFVEGRAKVSLGDAFGVPTLRYTFIGGNLGYGSGTASVARMGAQTTYWGLELKQGIANTPVSLSLNYDHFENRVDGLGPVWKESKFMAGAKFLFPSTDVARRWVEPTVPLPVILRTVMTF
jgi:hypothetical protein